MPFISPEDLPDPGMEPGSPALQVDSLPSDHQRSLMVGMAGGESEADEHDADGTTESQAWKTG